MLCPISGTSFKQEMQLSGAFTWWSEAAACRDAFLQASLVLPQSLSCFHTDRSSCSIRSGGAFFSCSVNAEKYLFCFLMSACAQSKVTHLEDTFLIKCFF